MSYGKSNGKPIVIVVEGPDKVGKTTFISEFNKKTSFRYLVLDRLTTSSMVYTTMFGRGEDVIEYYQDVQKTFGMNFSIVQVLLTSNNNDILERLRSVNEKLPKELDDIDEVKETFLRFSKSSGFNVVIINTSKDNVNEVVGKVEKFVEGLED